MDFGDIEINRLWTVFRHIVNRIRERVGIHRFTNGTDRCSGCGDVVASTKDGLTTREDVQIFGDGVWLCTNDTGVFRDVALDAFIENGEMSLDQLDFVDVF